MIADKIENLRLYKNLNPQFEKAFDYMESTDFNNLEMGKHTICGEDVFALFMEYETKDIRECRLEGHRKYIDIQYILEGKEIIGFTSLVGHAPHIPYDAEKDIAFYQAECSPFKLAKGNFTILFPDDLHMPCVKVEDALKVRKLVIKVKASAHEIID